MRKDEFKKNQDWVLRRNTRNLEAVRVKLLDMKIVRKRTKVRIRHVGGELDGLEEFVSPAQLVSRWGEWCKEQRRQKKLVEYCHLLHAPGLDQVVARAIEICLEASGDSPLVSGAVEDPASLVYPAKLDRVSQRAGKKPEDWRRLKTFNEGDGKMYVPWTYLLEIACRFARREPDLVEQRLELMQDGTDFGKMFPWLDHAELVKLIGKELIEDSPSRALLRQWMGQRRGTLHEKVLHLERLTYRALNELRKARRNDVADRIEDELEALLRSKVKKNPTKRYKPPRSARAGYPPSYWRFKYRH